MDREYDIIPILTNVAQGAVKEKVIRVVVATFKVCEHWKLPMLHRS